MSMISGCWISVLLCAVTGTVVEEVVSPAAPRSGEPNLVRGDDGKVYLSWIEHDGEEATLRFSVWEGSAWSKSRTVASGKNWFVNWADFPSLAVLADGTLAAHWLSKSGRGTYSYDVRVAISRDAGSTWSAPITPHRDGTKTEHGFVSLVPLSADQFGLFWLDGRQMKGEHDEDGGDMTLRHTTLGVDGRLGEEVLVDGRVCECCQTSATRLDDGSALVVYRDRSSDEVRDIGRVRIKKGKPSRPRIVFQDRWKIDGCPVNGPAIASRGPIVAVAWFTMGHDEKGRVQLAWSTDSGETFDAPLTVDDGRPLGRVDLLLLDAETALVSWLAETDDDADIRLCRLRRGVDPEPSVRLVPTRRSRASGFPCMERTGDRIIVAWTDAVDPPRVRTVLLSVGKSPGKGTK